MGGERRAWAAWLATLVLGALCLSAWQVLPGGCPGGNLAAGLAAGGWAEGPAPAYTLLTAANASNAGAEAYPLWRLPAGDYERLINITDFRFVSKPWAPEATCPPDLLLLVLVHSAPGNSAKRATIRSTWGTPRESMRLVFLVGEVDDDAGEAALRAEQHLHGDLVQGHFRDAYRNMTYKHVMALKWAAYHCSGARYVLKTDDDVFVNMPTVVAFLSGGLSPWGARRLLLCRPFHASMVKRSWRSKWRVSFTEYPARRYPTYCPGWAVLYSPDVVFRLYEEAQRARYFWIDDVLVTGILAQRADLEHTSPPGPVLSEHDVAALLEPGALPPPPFLYGPPDMRADAIVRLWHLVTHNTSRTQAQR